MIAVFLPTAFVGGVTGEFFRQFGWTAAAAVLFSLLVARLLTPMMAAYLLKRSRRSRRLDEPILADVVLGAGSAWCLQHRL